MTTDKLIDLDVSPSWWRTVKRTGKGPVPLAIHIAFNELKRTEVIELHATDDSLIFRVLPDERPEDEYKDLAREIRRTIEGGIEIERSDMRPDPETAITRAELEVQLREFGFEEDVGAALGENTIWHIPSGAMYVLLGPAGVDDNKALWGSSAEAEPGAKVSYATVLRKLTKLVEQGYTDAVGPNEPGSIFSGHVTVR